MDNILKRLYPNDWQQASGYIDELINLHKTNESVATFSEKDCILVTYGDTISFDKKGLKSLKYFCDVYMKDIISMIHLLPIHPYTSDEGYAVTDYLKVRKSLGSWVHVRDLRDHFRLMFDGVFNHTSASHSWFEGFLNDDSDFEGYYIEGMSFEGLNPRNTPLAHSFKDKTVRTTFSPDQVDLNYRNFYVLMEVLHIIGVYLSNGGTHLRLDAVRYLWKVKEGEETHLFSLLSVIRNFMNHVKPGSELICEINGPEDDNKPFREYGHTYRFELAPLIISGLISGKAAKLSGFLNKYETSGRMINMLATHDGISMRAIDGLLDDEEIQLMREQVKKQSGFESIVDDQLYELNINMLDMLSFGDLEMDLKRYMMAHFVILSLQGVPAIYIHSILGSRGSYPKYLQTGDKRAINRGQLKLEILEHQLTHSREKMYIFDEFEKLLNIRRNEVSFHPEIGQEIVHVDSRLLIIQRGDIRCVCNFSEDEVDSSWHYPGVDLISGREVSGRIKLEAYQYMWIKKRP